MADTIEDDDDADDRPLTPGGLPRDLLRDRPPVGNGDGDASDDTHKDPAANGVQSPPGLDEEKDFERRNPGS